MFEYSGSKFEIRISKSETNLKFKGSNVPNRHVLNFEFGTFEFVSNFGFCASDLPKAISAAAW
jgi:hypothetical protein